MVVGSVVSPYDAERMQDEIDRYHVWMEQRCEEVYRVAEEARAKGYDLKTTVEIPRAADLASRTEKLLEEYLDGIEIANDIRELLAIKDRENTAIEMALSVANQMHDKTADIQRSIDSGLRVGLAILTEAVLVAPLAGIGQVQVLNNLDGSRFVSIEFCGPIRAAGGTAQALAVLIADMIRRELGLAKYEPTTPEVERVKEEFGLYRKNLQYRPPPEEVEVIVRACPVMVNGEQTEDIECAGYREVRNIEGGRVRGGVLLVIGEGLCLKAPKIRKHTERLEIPGWEFISHFADKALAEYGGDSEGEKRRTIKKIDRFMDDIIAGRPVFGEPNTPGGFRLRYGRPRNVGLAAAAINPVSMTAMGSFLSVGTQMKIERPGKACAVTPCTELDGPSVLLNSGTFGRVQSMECWTAVESNVSEIWDNGELMLGFGEFVENNKELVPAAYQPEWFASDLCSALNTEKTVEEFSLLINTPRQDLPLGIPFTGDAEQGLNDATDRLQRRIEWHRFLRTRVYSWEDVTALADKYLTAVPPPWNLNWHDLPVEFIQDLVDSIKGARFESSGKSTDAPRMVPAPDVIWLRIPGAATNWNPADDSEPEASPGTIGELPKSIQGEWPHWLHLAEHGLVKSALLVLGVNHHHDGDDILISHGWQPLLEGLGFAIPTEDNQGLGKGPTVRIDACVHAKERLSRIADALSISRNELERVTELEQGRQKVRLAAETAARQRGASIEETDADGSAAASEIIDSGPEDSGKLRAAEELLDEHEADGSLWVIRKCGSLRWVASAPCRVGCRMGRPEKSAPRLMKTSVNSLFPIANHGGPQRLLTVASKSGSFRVELGIRECTECGRRSPFTMCHNRNVPDEPNECGGRTEPVVERMKTNQRRKGTYQSVNLADILEVKRRNLGLDRIPEKVKAVKVLNSMERTPEPLEKGLLRAKNEIPVFKDGTVRYDMIDVPVTHFRPREIGTVWQKLTTLGYTHDIYGEPLKSDEQMLELLPQDFIASRNAEDYFIRVCRFIDELLERFYHMDPYYQVSTGEDLVGQLCIALAPHTSGGVLTRLIGWTNASAGYAHPLFHASKRRNCDGDEDAIMLLLDGLLNFSRVILPATRGGLMDAPLVLTTRLKPTELDKEALNVDATWMYDRAFYEATQSQPHPSKLVDRMDIVEARVETIGAMRGYGFTHDCDSLDSGPINSSYKILKTMIDKMNAQLALGQRLRAVEVQRVASSVIESHFLPDLRGNLVAFTRQKVRCVRCGESYRRMPLAGKCIKNPQDRDQLGRRGLRFTEDEGNHQCGGNLVLTVSEGSVRKYIKVMKHVIDHYGVSQYTRQRVDCLAASADSLFKNDRVKVYTLDDFL